MLALRCGGGAAAYLTAQTTTAARNGDGRGAVHTVRAWNRDLRVLSSPCSLPHPTGAPWAVRCSPCPPHVEGHRAHNKGRNEAWEAMKAAIADTFRPLLRNLDDTRNLGYQMGILSGIILAMVVKDFKNNYVLLDAIRSVCIVNILSFGSQEH